MSDNTPVVTVRNTGKHNRPTEVTLEIPVWGDVVRLLNEENPPASTAITKELAAAGYKGTFEEDDGEVTITPTAKWAPNLLSTLDSLGLTYEVAEAPAKGSPEAKAKSPKSGVCEFSGEATSGGKFRPGYDMKMRGALTRIIDNTELGDDDSVEVGMGNAVQSLTVDQAIDKLVEYGWYGTGDAGRENLQLRRRAAFKKIEDAKTRKAEAEAERTRQKEAKAAAEAAAKANAETETSEDEAEAA